MSGRPPSCRPTTADKIGRAAKIITVGFGWNVSQVWLGFRVSHFGPAEVLKGLSCLLGPALALAFHHFHDGLKH